MVSPNPPSNVHPQAFKGGKMLVISPNYSLSLHPTLERNHLRHSTSRYKKKQIPFIWCNFSSFSPQEKKQADHFQLLHTICPSVKQSLGPGIFRCSLQFTLARCVGSRCSTVRICPFVFFCTQAFHQNPVGRYFLDAFIHLSSCKRIFSYFSGSVLLPGWLDGCKMAFGCILHALWADHSARLTGGTLWRGEVNMPSVVEEGFFVSLI